MRKKRNTNAVVEVEEDKAEGSDDDVEQLGGREVRGGSMKYQEEVGDGSVKIEDFGADDQKSVDKNKEFASDRSMKNIEKE